MYTISTILSHIVCIRDTLWKIYRHSAQRVTQEKHAPKQSTSRSTVCARKPSPFDTAGHASRLCLATLGTQMVTAQLVYTRRLFCVTRPRLENDLMVRPRGKRTVLVQIAIAGPSFMVLRTRLTQRVNFFVSDITTSHEKFASTWCCSAHTGTSTADWRGPALRAPRRASSFQ